MIRLQLDLQLEVFAMGSTVPAVSTGSFLPAFPSSQCSICKFRTYAEDGFSCLLCRRRSPIVKAFLDDYGDLLAHPVLHQAAKLTLVLQTLDKRPFLITGDHDLLFHTKPAYRAPMAENFKPGFWDVYRYRIRELTRRRYMLRPEIISGTDIYTMFTMFSTDTNLYIAAFAMSDPKDESVVSA